MARFNKVSLKTPTVTLDIAGKQLEELLLNVFITAIEGGSNYWCNIESPPRVEGLSYSESVYEYVVRKKQWLSVYDAEEPDEKLGDLHMRGIMEGLRLIAMSSELWALEAELNDEMDAETSDILFQYFVLGELVYG